MERTCTYNEVHKAEFVLMQPELDEHEVTKVPIPAKKLSTEFTGLSNQVYF